MRVIWAFIRAAFHNTYIYRLDFWVRLISAFIMMYATYSLWDILYAQNPDAFGMSREQMTTYGVLGMMLAPLLDSAVFVQFYISEQVRSGVLELDLMKPLNFIFHMFSRQLGMFFVQFLFQALPAFLFAYFFLEFGLPATPWLALVFLFSLFLGFLIFFAVSLLIGMLSIVTLRIDSYTWAYFSLIRFASGQFVPLWMFPPLLAAVVSFLPFQAVYFVPMSIYIGAGQGELTTLILSQVAWLVGLYLTVQLFWLRVQRRITVQGG
jgi:ABC-2 type transport system permease protein